MTLDATTVGVTVGDDDPDRDARRRVVGPDPTALNRDPDRVAAFPVDGPDELVHVCDVRLQLDDEEGASTGMPGEDVDDAPLAVDRERDLGLGDPLRQLGHVPRDQLVESGMARVQQPIEVAGSPAGREIDANVERRRR